MYAMYTMKTLGVMVKSLYSVPDRKRGFWSKPEKDDILK